MSTPRTSLDSSGRLEIPSSIREELGLEAGSVLELSVRHGRLVVRPASPEIRIVERDGLPVAELMEPRPRLTEREVRAVRREVRERRD